MGTTVIIKSGKAKYAWTGVPMVFLFLTTLTASHVLIGIFRDKAANAAAFNFTAPAFLVFLMAALAIFAPADMLHTWYGYPSSIRKASAGQTL